MELAWQESLFGGDTPLPDFRTEPSSAGPVADLRRIRLDERSWLDVSEGWMPRSAELFAELVETAPWEQRERWMYEATVLEPRLVAAWSGDALRDLPDAVQAARQLLGRHYGVELDSVLANLYRDGRDGVAWHGDRVRHQVQRAVVVTVGLGERRRFLLRPGTSGPATVSLVSGEGDLIVMGGRCQHEWQHTVPKARGAGARLSLTMRHSGPLPDTGPPLDSGPVP